MDSLAYRYIAIEGLIGAGKTTLTRALVDDYQATPIFEQFDDNPFLPLFYKDPGQYGFPLELSFLAERYHQLIRVQDQGNLFHPYLLADYHFDKCLLFAQVNLPKAEFQLFRTFFQVMKPAIKQPDLILYLYISPENALKHIRKRGRSYENSVSADYLDALQQGYLNHFKQNPQQRIVLLEVNDFDFVQNESDFLFVKHLLSQHYEMGLTRVNPRN